MRLVRCDVCETETDDTAVKWIEMSIPAEMLDVPGDYQRIDVCSLQCVSMIGADTEPDAAPPPPPVDPTVRARPRPVQLEPMQDNTGVEVRNRIR